MLIATGENVLGGFFDRCLKQARLASGLKVRGPTGGWKDSDRCFDFLAFLQIFVGFSMVFRWVFQCFFGPKSDSFDRCLKVARFRSVRKVRAIAEKNGFFDRCLKQARLIGASRVAEGVP